MRNVLCLLFVAVTGSAQSYIIPNSFHCWPTTCLVYGGGPSFTIEVTGMAECENVDPPYNWHEISASAVVSAGQGWWSWLFGGCLPMTSAMVAAYQDVTYVAAAGYVVTQFGYWEGETVVDCDGSSSTAGGGPVPC